MFDLKTWTKQKKENYTLITLINLRVTILLIISENIMPVTYKKNNISHSFGVLISFWEVVKYL